MNIVKQWGLAMGVSLLLIGCGSVAKDKHYQADGDVALINGKVYTVDQNKTVAEAVVIRDGNIVFVGDSDDASAHYTSRTEIIDLKGKLVLPGLQDSHQHPLEAGSEAVTCVLDSERSPAQQKALLAACGKQETGLEWVLGWGHSLEHVLALGDNPRELLDELIPDRPVAIMEETSHSIWVNSMALALAGVTKDSPQPEGGAILKSARTGEPNGILLDTAGDLVFDIAFAPNAVMDEMNYQGLLHGLAQVAEQGITSLVDARLYWKRGYLKAWDRAEREGTLTARTILSLWAYPLEDDTQQLATLKGLYRDDPDRLVRINQVKMYSDGILHNSTAAVIEPYQEYFEEVGKYGLNYFNKSRMTQYVTELEKVGFDMHIHAIGDRGVRESLDAIEQAMTVNRTLPWPRRHRLTHVEMVHKDDYPRFADLGVIADFQLAGDFTKPEHAHWVEEQIGDRHKHMLPVRTVYDTGALVTLSSDWDVSALSPFVGMQNALQRGAQSLPDMDAAIRAYTINPAILMRQETRTGTIEVGKWGDLIVVDQDILTADVSDVANTRVLLTLLEGEIVYLRPGW